LKALIILLVIRNILWDFAGIILENEFHSTVCYICLQVSTDEIESLYKTHSIDQQQLHVFFLLRVALAPVIEAVILLDRLLYLLEQVSNLHASCDADVLNRCKKARLRIM
jgi:hypothetical protein